MVAGVGLKRARDEGDELPQFLKEAAQLVDDLNVTWIVYDRDGTEVDGLTNWEELH
jgi:hypothetical protein